jgi:hypothetical protein
VHYFKSIIEGYCGFERDALATLCGGRGYHEDDFYQLVRHMSTSNSDCAGLLGSGATTLSLVTSSTTSSSESTTTWDYSVRLRGEE